MYIKLSVPPSARNVSPSSLSYRSNQSDPRDSSSRHSNRSELLSVTSEYVEFKKGLYKYTAKTSSRIQLETDGEESRNLGRATLLVISASGRHPKGDRYENETDSASMHSEKSGYMKAREQRQKEWEKYNDDADNFNNNVEEGKTYKEDDAEAKKRKDVMDRTDYLYVSTGNRKKGSISEGSAETIKLGSDIHRKTDDIKKHDEFTESDKNIKTVSDDAKKSEDGKRITWLENQGQGHILDQAYKDQEDNHQENGDTEINKSVDMIRGSAENIGAQEAVGENTKLAEGPSELRVTFEDEADDIVTLSLKDEVEGKPDCDVISDDLNDSKDHKVEIICSREDQIGKDSVVTDKENTNEGDDNIDDTGDHNDNDIADLKIDEDMSEFENVGISERANETKDTIDDKMVDANEKYNVTTDAKIDEEIIQIQDKEDNEIFKTEVCTSDDNEGSQNQYNSTQNDLVDESQPNDDGCNHPDKSTNGNSSKVENTGSTDSAEVENFNGGFLLTKIGDEMLTRQNTYSTVEVEMKQP